jgi:hypothetical protein
VSVKTILRKYDIKACPAAADGPEADRLLRFILLRGSQEGRSAPEVFKDVQEVARVSCNKDIISRLRTPEPVGRLLLMLM